MLCPRADRLSALGELSAGLAHEIRNPLGSVEGALQILSRSDVKPEVRTEFTELAKKEVDRLKSLLTTFLEFARPRPPQRILIEPPLLLDDVAKLAGETAKMSGVSIQVKSSGTIPSVYVDADQIKQVLLNLVLNAVQAMPNGGEIVLAASVQSGKVSLTVKDQGVGISPEDMEKVFDPFFTTRSGGTGLGLSIAYQIVSRHDGHISVWRNPDRGVTFSVNLPVLQKEDRAEHDLRVKA